MSLIQALTLASQVYNIIFIAIALILFALLFKTQTKDKKDAGSWRILFASFVLLAVKEVLIILRANEILSPELYLNGIIDLAFIVLFLYVWMKK